MWKTKCACIIVFILFLITLAAAYIRTGTFDCMEARFFTLTAPQHVFCLALCLGAYLLGSIPFGLVIAKIFCNVDPRVAGSGNIGTTNVARLCGFHFGVLTLFCDVFKGLLPVALALHLLQFPFMASVVGLCALLGHLHSIFLGFKGGKAVATTVGVFLPLSFFSVLISGVICILTIWCFGFVSLGSLVLATLLPICLVFFGRYDLLPLALIVLALIFFKHRSNIGRLLRGEEKSFLKSRQR